MTGDIGRQSVKTFVVEAFGIGIGFFSMLFIYPLEDELFGYTQFLYAFGIFLVPFMSLGLPSFIIKFQPYFQNKEGGKNSFLTFSILLSLILPTICVLFIYILKQPVRKILYSLDFDVHLISENLIYLLIIGFLQVQIAIFTAYLSNFGKIAFPTVISQLGYKLFLPVIVLLYFYDYYSIEITPLYLIGFLAIVLIFLIAYGIRDRVIFITKNVFVPTFAKLKEMLSYLLFSSLTSISNILAFRIDLLMIAALLSLEANGVYAKVLIIASVIDLPTKIVARTASPEISRSWENNNFARIKSIYKKSSLNLFLFGGFLFLLMWNILDDLILISSNPDSFRNAREIFTFLCIGKLIDLIASVNKSVIGYSPSYKVNFILVAILGVSNIILNYFLIGKFDIIGAAIATALSLVLYNFLQFIFIYFKYKMQPLSKELLIIFGIGLFTFFMMKLIPDTGNVYADLLLKSFMVCVFYIVPVLIIRPSIDFSNLIQSVYNKISR